MGTNQSTKKPPSRSDPPLNREQQEICEWLSKTKYKKRLIGGVDEADVWKKLQELNTLFDAALLAERARYDALLEERCRIAGFSQAGGDDP